MFTINDQNLLKEYLKTGIVTDAMDADPLNTTLAAHDRRFHPKGFDPKRDTCKFREQLAKGDDTDQLEKAEREEEAAAAGNSPSPQDYQTLHDVRDRLEGVARLLNGRTGNIPALQSSRRWQMLNDYPNSPDLNEIRRLAQSADPAIAKAANDLAVIANNIIKSSQSGWTTPAGMVPDASDLPQIPGQPAAPSGGFPAHSHSKTPSAAPSAPGNGAFSDDDAKALLFRAAKSINYHIDQGDNTPNAKAIARLHAAENDIRALGDKQLEGFMDDIFASEKNGFTQRIGKVPLPSQAWQQAHQPQMPAGGLAGLLGALFGGMGGGMPAAPQRPANAPATKKNPWVPFQAPSPYANAIAAINANHPAATDPDYWKNKADAMTPQQAVQDMESKGYIEKDGFRDAFDPNDPGDDDLWGGWTPDPSKSADTARCAAVCFDDLRSRFPNMQWPSNLSVRCGTQYGTGGQSVHTKDDQRHAILFGYIKNPWPGSGLGRDHYGHNDAGRFSYDVLRHEMGHAIMSGELPNGKRKMTLFHDAVSQAYGYPATDLIQFAGKYVSSYAVTNKGRGPSMSEMMAEMFSLATSPDYKPGYLPPEIETFFFSEVLGIQPDA